MEGLTILIAIHLQLHSERSLAQFDGAELQVGDH